MTSLAPISKSKKRIMRSFKIFEISGVDDPAQEGAKVTIVKRNTLSKKLRLTVSVDGHSHLLEDREEGGETSYTTAEGEEYGHSHPWVRNPDGTISIGEAQGHTHELAPESFEMRYPPTSAGDDHSSSVDSTETEEPNMSDDTKKQLEELTAKVGTLETELGIAKSFGGLNDAQKAHYSTLDDKGKAEFLAMDSEARGKVMKSLADDNPVIFTGADGTEYRKKDDPRLVALAKRDAEREKEVAEQKAINKRSRLAKQAETDIPHLPGNEDVKVALLDAIEGIPDDKLREGALSAIKANNEQMSEAFRDHGVPRPKKDQSASDELDEMAKAHAKEHNVSYETAYAIVVATPKGSDLYNKSLN